MKDSEGRKHDAPPRRFSSPKSAAQLDGLACDDAGDWFTAEEAGCIDDPVHHGGVGIDIWRGDITFGADEREDHRGIAARQTLQFPLRQARWVTCDPAFAATIGDVYNGALPGHPSCQGLDLVQRHADVITEAAFAGTASVVVLHPIAGENFDLSVISRNRNTHLQRTRWPTKDLPYARWNVSLFPGQIQLPKHHLIGIDPCL